MAQSLGIGTRDVELPLQRFCVSRLLLRDDGGLLLLRLPLCRYAAANTVGADEEYDNCYDQQLRLMLHEPIKHFYHYYPHPPP